MSKHQLWVVVLLVFLGLPSGYALGRNNSSGREHDNSWTRDRHVSNHDRDRHEWRHEQDRQWWRSRERRREWERDHRMRARMAHERWEREHRDRFLRDRDRRPPGWDQGRKTGWGDCDAAPGQAKKAGCDSNGWRRPIAQHPPRHAQAKPSPLVRRPSVINSAHSQPAPNPAWRGNN